MSRPRKPPAEKPAAKRSTPSTRKPSTRAAASKPTWEGEGGKGPERAPARPRRARVERPWTKYAKGSEIQHFADFCKEHLILSNDRWAGLALELEAFQIRMMGEALAYDAEGWPCWNSIIFVLPRKNGKTQLLAAYAVYRLFVTDDSPEILLAAASDRNAGRLFKAAANFIRRSPVLSKLARVREYAGEIVREDGLGVIYRVASDPNRLHGYDPSLVICDELAQWTKPSLEEAYAALTSGGGARGAPQTFTITTAGEASTRHSSILGRLLTAADQAPEKVEKPGLTISRLHESKTLVYNHTAPTTDPFDTKAMKLANPASWITETYLAKQAANPELTDAQVLQLHGCVWAAAGTTYIAPEGLEGALARGRLLGELEDGETVVLGFDGSETRDETWLTACAFDGRIQPLQRWAKPAGAPDGWRIPRHEIHEAIAAAHERFDVAELAADPPGWYSEVDAWAERYGEEVVLMFETRMASRIAPACQRLKAGVNDGTVSFVGPLAAKLAEHLGNCVAKETPYGTAVTKDHPDSPRKIDGAVASIIAYDRAMWHAAEGGGFVGFAVDIRGGR